MSIEKETYKQATLPIVEKLPDDVRKLEYGTTGLVPSQKGDLTRAIFEQTFMAKRVSQPEITDANLPEYETLESVLVAQNRVHIPGVQKETVRWTVEKGTNFRLISAQEAENSSEAAK